MKKVLLSAAAMVAVLSSYAQTINEGGTGFEYNYGGTETEACWSDTARTHYNLEQTADAFKITGKGSSSQYSDIVWNAITNGCDKQTPVDISGNPTITIRAKSSIDGAKLGVQIVDENNKGTNCDDCSAAFTLTTDYVDYTFDFTGKFFCQYGCGLDNTDKEAVDATAITNFFFNPSLAAAKFDGVIEIDYIKIGDAVTGINTAIATETAVSVYPNPASENVTFSKSLTDVTVFNALGNVIETAATSAGLNVSNYNAGIYFIKSAEGTTQFVVK